MNKYIENNEDIKIGQCCLPQAIYNLTASMPQASVWSLCSQPNKGYILQTLVTFKLYYGCQQPSVSLLIHTTNLYKLWPIWAGLFAMLAIEAWWNLPSSPLQFIFTFLYTLWPWWAGFGQDAHSEGVSGSKDERGQMTTRTAPSWIYTVDGFEDMYT